MRRIRGWLIGLGLALGVPAALHVDAAEGDSELFKFFSLEFEGKLRARVIVDLDGDGLDDLGVLLSRGDDRSVLRFQSCLQTAEGGFAADCASVPVPAGMRVFDVGEIDGLPGAELVIVTSGGIRTASFLGGRFGPFTPVLPVQTLFKGTDPGEPARLRFLWDLDADGRLELILPDLEGPRILRYSNAGVTLLQQLDSRAEISYRLGGGSDEEVHLDLHPHAARTEARFTAPGIFIEDFDGDGRRDVVTLVGRHLRVFLQDPAGRFAESPSVELDRSILDDDEQDDPFAGEALTFSDLDGDGLCDIIAIKWGSPSERTRIDRYIYFARAGLEYPEAPDQIVRSRSAFVRFMISDLNNDGKRDLVIPFFHFAPSQALKVMTQNAVKIQFRLFLMGDEGRYSQDAGKSFARVDRRIGLDYQIDILGILFQGKTLPEGKFRPLITFNADANGDGFPDLLADTGRDRLVFHWGNREARYSGSPDHVIAYESSMDFDLADLNHDGKTDVITYYAPRKGSPIQRLRRSRSQAGRKGPPGRPRPEPRQPAGPRGPTVKILLSR